MKPHNDNSNIEIHRIHRFVYLSTSSKDNPAEICTTDKVGMTSLIYYLLTSQFHH